MSYIKVSVLARCAVVACALLVVPPLAEGSSASGNRSLEPKAELKPVIQLISDEGTAPLTVHVHALESVLGEGSPLTARYEWDFGDPRSPYNRLRGFVASHVYDAPGSYEITLSVTDEQGLTDLTRASIEVLANDRPALYVAASGNDDDPGTSPDQPLRTIERGFELLEDDMRLLFRRGDVFDAAGANDLVRNNVLIGAYGSGDRPVLRWVGGMGCGGIIKVSESDQHDIVIQDLAFDSIYDVGQQHDVVDAVVPAGRNVTIRNCLFGAVSLAINGNRRPAGLLAMDNEASVLGTYFCWGEGSDYCFIGNSVAGSHWEHNIRFGGADRVLIAHNKLTNEPKRTIWAMLGSYCYITGNELHDGRTSVGPNPYVGGPDERFQWVVVEANRFWKDSDGNAAVELLAGAEQVMVRNNIIEATGMPAVSVAGYDEDMQRTNVHVRILNNTGFNVSQTGCFIEVRDGGQELVMANNLYAAPNLVTGASRTANAYIEAENLSFFNVIHHNVWAVPAEFDWVPDAYHYIWPYWSDAQGYKTPQQWEAYDEAWGEAYEVVELDEDFTPLEGTVAAVHAVPVTGVCLDFYGAWRPEGNWSAGAVEANPVDPNQDPDVNDDGVVDIDDLFAVLADWGTCPPPPASCPADVNGDRVVDVDDIFVILANWT